MQNLSVHLEVYVHESDRYSGVCKGVGTCACVCCLPVSIRVTVDLRVCGHDSLLQSTFPYVLNVHALEKNRQCARAWVGSCMCANMRQGSRMHVSMHMSTIAACCATEAYFCCWVYTVVAGLLCVGCMFKCVV